MQKAKSRIRRIGIGIAGGLVLIIGVIAIPYPGPGWLIVFAGLAILATEFAWAQRLLDVAKGKYDAWQAWLARQSFVVKALIWTLTAFVVIITVWLLNGYGLINNWLHLGLDWVQSPLFH
ncbi:MAG: TIGR02611 family protein [Candidatus Saccharimonadales bacterium]